MGGDRGQKNRLWAGRTPEGRSRPVEGVLRANSGEMGDEGRRIRRPGRREARGVWQESATWSAERDRGHRGDPQRGRPREEGGGVRSTSVRRDRARGAASSGTTTGRGRRRQRPRTGCWGLVGRSRTPGGRGSPLQHPGVDEPAHEADEAGQERDDAISRPLLRMPPAVRASCREAADRRSGGVPRALDDAGEAHLLAGECEGDDARGSRPRTRVGLAATALPRSAPARSRRCPPASCARRGRRASAARLTPGRRRLLGAAAAPTAAAAAATFSERPGRRSKRLRRLAVPATCPAPTTTSSALRGRGVRSAVGRVVHSPRCRRSSARPS